MKENKIQESFQVAKVRVISEFEKVYIREVLLSYRGNISKAAKAAHKNRRAFWELMRKHNLSAEPFKSASA